MLEKDLLSDYQNKTSLSSTVWNQELGKTSLERFMCLRTLCHDFCFNPCMQYNLSENRTIPNTNTDATPNTSRSFKVK